MRTPPTSGLSTNRACPAPAGDHRTRQWLQRVAADWPPSVLRRTNEFSPIRISSCGLTFTSMVAPGGSRVFASADRNRALDACDVPLPVTDADRQRAALEGSDRRGQRKFAHA